MLALRSSPVHPRLRRRRDRDGAKLIGFFRRIVLIIPLLCAEVLAALARGRALAGGLARHALDLGERNAGYRRSKLDGTDATVPDHGQIVTLETSTCSANLVCDK